MSLFCLHNAYERRRTAIHRVRAPCERFTDSAFIFSERELTFTMCCRPSVCRLSVTLVHPTQPIEIFGNVSIRHLVPWPSVDINGKFYGDRPRGTSPSAGLIARGVAKYSDFGPIEGYISVQDRR